MATKPEKLIIQIDVKDADKAKKALKDIEVGFKNVGEKGKKNVGRLRLETEGLRRSLGQVRNNMLLVAFATEGLRRTLGGFVQATAQLETFEARLKSLSGSSETAKLQMAGFMDIAARTPFTVQEVVEGGVALEAFGADAEALIPTLANVAAFMGESIPYAASAFGRAFAGGQGAADVFREKGILKLIRDFAELENLQLDSLEDFQIAMIKAFTDKDGSIANGITNLEGTINQSVSNLEDAVFRFRARVGEELAPSFRKLVKVMTDFFNSIQAEQIVMLTAAMKLLGIAVATFIALKVAAVFSGLAVAAGTAGFGVGALATAFYAAAPAAVAFNAAISANPYIFVAAALASLFVAHKSIVEIMALQSDQMQSTGKSVEEYIEELEKARELKSIDKLNEDIAKNVVEMQKQLDMLNATSEAEKLSVKLGRDLSAKEMRLIKLIVERKEELKELADIEKSREKFEISLNKIQSENLIKRAAQGKTLKDVENSRFDAFRDNEEQMSEIRKNLSSKNLKLEQLRVKEMEAIGKLNLIDESLRTQARLEIEENFQKKRQEIIQESEDKITQMKKDSVSSDEEAATLLLEQTRSFNLMVQDSYMQMFTQIEQRFSSLVKSNMDQELKALKKTDKFRNASTEERENMENDIKAKFADQQRMAFRAQQMMQIAQVFMTLNRAIFDIEAAAAPLIMAKVPGTAAKMASLITSLKISSAIQAGLIGSQKPPAFARGGSFVTDGPQQIIVGDNPGGAERVDITPLSSPNFDGPQSSGVTVNIMGNIIGTEEFVRDSLLPEIDRSIRRNLA